MVTPTFAAGLGVVVAAGLAVSMTARTVLHFSGPGQVRVCVAGGCAGGPYMPGGVGTLASAKPGVRLAPDPSGPQGSVQPSPSSTGGQSQSGEAPADDHVVIDYQTTQKWSWGFDGQIKISGMSAASLRTWRLQFDYPGTSIVEVQGARWESTGQDSGVAEAESPSQSASASASAGSGSNDSGPAASAPASGGAAPGEASPSHPDSTAGSPPAAGQKSPGQSSQQNAVVITITASGPPSAPSNCHFNNVPCSFH